MPVALAHRLPGVARNRRCRLCMPCCSQGGSGSTSSHSSHGSLLESLGSRLSASDTPSVFTDGDKIRRDMLFRSSQRITCAISTSTVVKLFRFLCCSCSGFRGLLPAALDHDHAQEGSNNCSTQKCENDGYSNGPHSRREEALEWVVVVNKGLRGKLSIKTALRERFQLP